MGMKESASPPPAPDYVGAAEATGASNLEAVRAQTQANRVNQYTPYGSLEYYQDPNAATPDQGWSSITTLSPAQQQLLDQQNKISVGLANLSDRGLSYVDKALADQVSMANLPTVSSNPTNDAYEQLMARYRPEMEKGNSALRTQLANQGIAEGSEAFTNAMRTQQQGENDLRSQAALNSISLGNQQQRQQMDYQNQQMGLRTALQNNPVNMLNAVRTGSQVTNPTFSSVPQQQNAGGVDYSSATKGQSDYAQGLYNSQVASSNAANSSAMGALGTLGLGAMMFL
jgi:hypothetical protein